MAGARTDALVVGAVAATIAYTVFYVVLELGAFGAVIAWRGAHDGGAIDDYRGAARRSPLIGAAAVLALIGLAGLPPGLAGLFGKIVIVRSVLAGGAIWLAVVIAVNAVIGLAYYARVIATLFTAREVPEAGEGELSGVRAYRPVLVVAALGVLTVVGLVIGFAPQIVLHAVDLAASP
jgi:NADH-quinone oxidoreductase subunit N